MLDTRSYPQLLLLGLCGALGLTMLVTAGMSTASLGAYNPTWDGTSEIRSVADSTDKNVAIVRNSSAYGDARPNQTVAVILSPTDPYTDRDLAAIQAFVRSGGTLLVAEDYRKHSNAVLAAVGADARINGAPLRDEQRAGPGPAFPRAEAVENHTFTAGVDTLMLNHGTVITPGEATTLVQSSEFSYLDTNRNQQLDNDEVLASRPVVTVEPVGDGTVLVVSDPSIFLNAMLDRTDNADFLTAVLNGHTSVLLDVSHTTALPPLVTLRLALQESSLAAFIAGTLSILSIFALSRVVEAPTWYRRVHTGQRESPKLSTEVVTTAIRARNPDWEEERVERVTDSLMTYRQKQETDD